MLYTLIGNGNANKKEVVSSLYSLSDAVGEDEDFWMIFVDPVSGMSEAYEAAVQWALKNSVPFEYVTSEAYTEEDTELPEWTRHADYCHFVKNPTAFTVKLTRVRPEADEDRAVLILSDDLDTDGELLSTIEKFIDLDIPVYDLGNQMVEITFEEVPEDEVIPEPLETPTPEDFHIEIKDTSEDDFLIEFTREDLNQLNLVELKSLVQSRGVVPRDMRSKESLIDALMNETPAEEEIAEHIVVGYNPPKFYLIKIDADGNGEMRPLTAKQAALVV